MQKRNKFLILFAATAITFGSLFAFAPHRFSAHGQHCNSMGYTLFNEHKGNHNCSQNMDNTKTQPQKNNSAADTTKSK